MQISYKFKNRWVVRQIPGDKAVIGRPNASQSVEIDLSPDTTVSRVHARIWFVDGHHWVEDLGSRFGTVIDGKKITGPTQVQIGTPIGIGETLLRIDSAEG